MDHRFLYPAYIRLHRPCIPRKVRPVLILQSTDLTHAGKPSVTIVPFTTNLLPPNPLRLRITTQEVPQLQQDSDILIDEIHTLHRSLLIEKIGRMPSKLFNKVL